MKRMLKSVQADTETKQCWNSLWLVLHKLIKEKLHCFLGITSNSLEELATVVHLHIKPTKFKRKCFKTKSDLCGIKYMHHVQYLKLAWQ